MPTLATIGVGGPLDTPLFSGGGSSSLVPGLFPVAINGRPYLLDTEPEFYTMRWRIESIPILREQADQAQSPAESSLNPDGYWRRAQDSWHHGAGQNFRDRDELADIYRFRSSKGIDPWTRYQLTLLKDTTQSRSSANTNVRCVVAGSRLYVADGTALVYTTDLSAYTPVTGTPGTTILSLTSDGFTVYFTDGSNIYTTNTGTSAATLVNTLDASKLKWCKGRLMAAGNAATKNSIYNITVIGTPPSALLTHFNSDFTWVDFTEGIGNIYAAGFSGDKSLIYRIQIKSDATALDSPIVCGELPDGETVQCIEGYLGNLWIGTSLGWRFATVDGQGNLLIGPLIATPGSVQCFEPQDRFMWFGYTNYDGTSTGLGRSDPTQFVVNPNQIAYASDLMVTGQGAILSVQTFLTRRVFTISGLGVYAEHATNKVASGTIDSGLFGYGLPDQKIVSFVDIRTAALAGSYTCSLAADGGSFTALGSESAAGDTGDTFPANQVRAERFEIRLSLSRSAGLTDGPTINRWTAKAFAGSQDGSVYRIMLPIRLYPEEMANRVQYHFDVMNELDILFALRDSRQVVTLDYFSTAYSGVVEDINYLPYGLFSGTEDVLTNAGTALVTFKRIV